MKTMTTVLLMALWGLGPAAPAQEVQVASDGWDFGIRDRGEKDQKIIKVRNTGDKILHINRVGVTCGCVRASMEKTILEPGETADLVLDLDTSRQAGTIAKHAWIETNDPKRRKVTLFVKGEIRNRWWLSAKNLNLGKVRKGSPATSHFFVMVAPGKKVKLKGVSCSDGRMNAVSEPFEEADGTGGWKITVSLSDKVAIGRFAAEVRVMTDDPALPNDRVRIDARIEGDLVLTPERLGFGSIIRGESKRLSFKVKKRQGAKDLKIEKVSCTDRQVALEIKPIVEGQLYVVNVTVTPTANRRRFQGKIWITTNVEGQKRVSVHYYGAVRPPPR